MKIRLSEIPADGRAYTYDRKTGELNEALSDLLEKRDYDVNLFIRPIGNAFEMRGHINTTLPEICSTCGDDFELAINRKVNEILFEDQEEDRKAQSVHGNNSVNFLEESGPSMTPYRGDTLDMGEYVHESIAFSEPFYPKCGGGGECLNQADVDRIRRELEAQWEQAAEKKPGHPGFQALKGIELGPKN